MNKRHTAYPGLDLFSLEGRRALITGSSQGIGYALAGGLASVGARVILNGRNRSKLADAASRLRVTANGVDELPFDATDQAATSYAIDDYEASEGPIDILINNAGMQHRSPLEDFDPATFDRLMKTNVYSVFHVGQAVARHMIKRGAGNIINICSVQTQLARPGIAPYTASKGAVANLTKGMATDWAQYGLKVNGLAPGYFETELTAALVADEAFTAWLANRTPAGRWGDVRELIGATIFLASDAASFVNGHILYVDGGITASL